MNNILKIYYDGECPFCKNYIILQNLKYYFKKIEIKNARDCMDEMRLFMQKGYNIDDGMILLYDNKIYYGYEVIQFLSFYTKEQNFLFKIWYEIFRINFVAKNLYFILKNLRKLYFFLNMKKTIL